MTKGNPSGLTGMGLGRWHAALRRIRVPPKELLPLGFGGLERANRDAFHGDKTLSHYVSLAMRDSQKEASIGELTFLMSATVSNAHLAQHVRQLCPAVPLPEDDSALRAQTHDAGTVVEAAVWRVFEEAGDREAVAELAEFLLREAQKGSQLINPKGRLLELGGAVGALRLGGKDNSPIFRASASINGESAESDEHGSKKEAEQEAAGRALKKAGLYPTAPQAQSGATPSVVRHQFEAPPAAAAGGGGGGGGGAGAESVATTTSSTTPSSSPGWKRFRLDPAHRAANVREEESPREWWRRGALSPKSAFHRCLLSPDALPECVADVAAFNGDLDGEATTTLRVTLRDNEEEGCESGGNDNDAAAASSSSSSKRRFFTATGPSTTQSRAAAALEANRFVLGLIKEDF